MWSLLSGGFCFIAVVVRILGMSRYRAFDNIFVVCYNDISSTGTLFRRMEQKDSSSLVVKGRLSTLARGLVVLECFGSAGTEPGITQISKRLSISKSTAHRIASTLADQSYLHRDE